MSFLQQAAEAAKKTGKIIFDMAANGIDTTAVPDDLIATRNDICSKCERITSFMMMRKCSECGCFLGVKTRLLYDPVETARNNGVKQYTKCPLGKW